MARRCHRRLQVEPHQSELACKAGGQDQERQPLGECDAASHLSPAFAAWPAALRALAQLLRLRRRLPPAQALEVCQPCTGSTPYRHSCCRPGNSAKAASVLALHMACLPTRQAAPRHHPRALPPAAAADAHPRSLSLGTLGSACASAEQRSCCSQVQLIVLNGRQVMRTAANQELSETRCGTLHMNRHAHQPGMPRVPSSLSRAGVDFC